MSLSPGEKLGPYEIIALIGKGGMGEVYRARDSRLDRDVAIKVGAAQCSERFDREARAVAALNHPNICTLFDVGPNYLTMEFVEGEAPEGPLPLNEALRIATQIADALQAAHEKGIVHRDLKPANIKVKPDGAVKVLDFGLAKLTNPAASGSIGEDSPTLSMAATQAGVILGTAAYMSPEQARGKPVDKRADIWAFGVVLYELITGKRLFRGEDVSHTMAAVIMQEPNLDAAPFEVRRLLKACLEKDPQKRLRDIGDVWKLLDSEQTSAAPASARPPSRPSLLWGAVSGLLALALAALAFLHFREKPEPHPLMRLSVDLGPQALALNRSTLAISPDGTRIVYPILNSSNVRLLATRLLDQPNPTILAGTDQAADPFFSPNGQWIGFFDGGKLKKVPAQGGAAVTLCDAFSFLGGSWGEDGNIVFATGTGLMRVPDAGGTPQAITKTADTGDTTHYDPQVLPSTGTILFTKLSATATDYENSDLAVLAPQTGKIKVLQHGAHGARYLPAPDGPGHIVYLHEGTLFGVAFDPKSLELRGTPSPLIEDILANRTFGNREYAFSDTGTFVYLSGKAETPTHPIQWLESSGKTTPLVAQPGAYDAPRFSPDGKRLAYSVTSAKGGDVWVYDLAGGIATQLTFTQPGARELAWSPDSKHLVYGTGGAQGAKPGLWWIRADGAGQPERLLEAKLVTRPQSISRDGRLMFAQNTDGLPDLFTLPLDMSDPDHPKPGKVEPFLTTPGVVEVDGAFSPDGRWVAYSSNEAGMEDIYVRPSNPNAGGKRKLSTTGGKFPAWSHDNRIFFLGGDNRMMVTTYSVSGDAFSFTTPSVWSDPPILRTGTRQNFDLAPDGKRIAMFPQAEAEQRQNLHAVFLLNYFDEIRRRIKP